MSLVFLVILALTGHLSLPALLVFLALLALIDPLALVSPSTFPNTMALTGACVLFETLANRSRSARGKEVRKSDIASNMLSALVMVLAGRY